MITVTGPDGATFNFPDGTPQHEIVAAMDKHYTGGRAAEASRASADRWAANRTGADQKRSVWERTKDDFIDQWNRSWIVEGYRQGYKHGAESDFEAGRFNLNPATSIGEIVGAWDNMFDNKGADAKAARAVQEERTRRQAFEARSKADPFWKAGDHLGDKIVHGGGALAGTLGAAALDPVSYIGAGSSLITKMGVQAFLAASTDVLAQQSAIGADVQDGYRLDQTIFSGAVGAGFQGVAHGLSRLAKSKPSIASQPADRIFKEELDAHDLIEKPTLSQADYTRNLPVRVAPEPKIEAPEPAPKVGAQPGGALVEAPAPKAGADDAADADPWARVDWSEAGSEARARAAVAHLDSLKKFIKPEQVETFIRWLGKEKVGSTEANHWNEEFFDFETLRSDPEQFFELHNALSDIFKPVYDEAGDAVKSWAKTREHIDAFGIPMSVAIKAHADITGELGAAYKVHALETVAMQHTDNLHRTMLKLRDEVANGDYSNVGRFAEDVQMTLLMDSMAAGAKSEIGRALNILKMAKRRSKLMDDINGQLATLHDVMGGKGDIPDATKIKDILDQFDKAYRKRGAAGLRDEIRKARKWGLWNYFGYAATGNLLTNPATFMRNFVGTGLHAAINVGERYVAAGVGTVRSVSPWRTAERVTFREANAYAAAIASALNDGLSAGWAAAKSSTSVTDGASSVESSMAVPFALNADRLRRWRSDPLRSLPDVVATIYFETTRTLAFRPMVAADEFYKTVATRMQLSALATREAAYRSARVGGAQSEKVFKDTLGKIMAEPTEAAIRQAEEFFAINTALDRSNVNIGAYRPDPNVTPEQLNLDTAAEDAALILQSIDLHRMAEDHARMIAFQNDGPAIRAWTSALRTLPLVKYLYVPFLRTPLLLTKAGLIDRNPVLAPFTKDGRAAFGNLIKAQSDINARLERGGAEADLVMARMVAGAGLMSLAYWMWSEGMLVGERSALSRQDGVLPNSIKIGDTWVQISPLSPIAEPLTLVANLAETIHEHKPDDDLAMALFGGVVAALTNAFVQKGPMAGLQDLHQIVFGQAGMSDDSRGRMVGKKVGESFVSALFPASAAVGAIATEFDPVIREANSLLEVVQQKVPVWSEQLPARRDFLGREIVRDPGQRGPFQAYKFSKETEDLMDQEFARLAKSDPELDIGPPKPLFNGVRITPEERWRVAEIQGQLWKHPASGLNMEQAVRELMFSEAYSYWPDAQRAAALKTLISQYRTGASWAIRNPKSEFYMAEMVRRTGLEKLETEAAKKGWDPNTAALQGRRYGLTREDAEAWAEIMGEPEPDPAP